MAMTDVGLYVHVPFCLRKCGYCDFYSIVPGGRQEDDLVEALRVELDATGRGDIRVETIFVGGGTPTSLSPANLGRLLQGLRALVDRDGPVEFSMEANPATLSEAKVAALDQAGVTRISIGAQSFEPDELSMLERLHCPADIVAAVEMVRRAGFEHINLDLIFGIPGQTLASWKDSLRRAVDLGPDHLACYGLTYEPGTPLRRRLDEGRVRRADEELEAEMYLATMEELTAVGFEQYEISNYGRPGGWCRHNLRYWLNQPGIGIGPAAASYMNGCRWRNVPDVDEYIRRSSAGETTAIEEETLSPRRRAGETAMLRLRLVEGILRDDFRQQTGFDPLDLFADAIARYSQAGLLEVSGDRICLTRRGRLVADTVITDFLLP